jgi:hypothetical protein
VRLSVQACDMYFVTKIALPGTAEAMVQEAGELVLRTVETQGCICARASCFSTRWPLSTHYDE